MLSGVLAATVLSAALASGHHTAPVQPPPDVHTFYDTASPTGPPANAEAVAGYVNGWDNNAQLAQNYPHAYDIPIDAVGNAPQYSRALDVEPGAAPVSSVVPWSQTRNHLGYWAVIYGSQSTISEVQQIMPRSIAVHYWVANPGGGYVPGSSATQTVWNGDSYDASYTPMPVSELFGPLPPPPPPPPPPAPPKQVAPPVVHHAVAPPAKPKPVVRKMFSFAKYVTLAAVAGIRPIRAPWAFRSCVEWRESTDGKLSPDLYGFLPSTWQELGMKGSPYTASHAEQWVAFQRAYARWGDQPWMPSDGCSVSDAM